MFDFAHYQYITKNHKEQQQKNPSRVLLKSAGRILFLGS